MSLPDNIWWTRKSRIEAEKRLLNCALHSELLLIWYSFFSVCISIYHLTKAESDGINTVVWVSFSVLILVLSARIHSRHYEKRATSIKECYESLYKLKAENNDCENDLETEYLRILDLSENHTDLDYYNAICIQYLTTPKHNRNEQTLTKMPTPYIWFCFLIEKLKIIVFYLLFYLIPIIFIYFTYIN